MRQALWAPVLALTFIVLFSSPAEAGEFDDLVPALDSALSDSVSLSGHVVYLDFWASWCIPCRKSFPWMTKLQAKYRDRGLRVVAVNVDRSHKAAETFLEKNGSGLSLIFDPNGQFARRLHLEVMPTSFIFDRDGELQETHIGFSIDDAPDIDDLIESLLSKEVAR